MLTNPYTMTVLIGLVFILGICAIRLARRCVDLAGSLARADCLLDELQALNKTYRGAVGVAEQRRAATESAHWGNLETIRTLEQRNNAQTHIITQLAARLPVAANPVQFHLTIPNVSQVIDLGNRQAIVWRN